MVDGREIERRIAQPGMDESDCDLVRIVPYREGGGGITGVVVTFIPLSKSDEG